MSTQQILLKILIVAFGATGVIGLLGYWPTIKDLYRKKPSANILSYALWTFTSLVGLLYSAFILSDMLILVVYALNLAACLIVILLTVGLKKKR